ncbi:uncharacterized protein [Gossypium hirsutum]|uniref:Uncharacterized protein n=1 Tax=Gossypium hirsutum TaxID=3635 RepID=A0A1U8NFL2_GOSHI|nr:uncharacterized protein LOC107947799 [Gossypium hirsutum]
MGFLQDIFSREVVGASYVDARMREFLNLRTVAAYEAEFLRLSHYVRGIVVTEYEFYVRFEDGLRRPIKRAKIDGPVRAGDPVVAARPQPCADCGRSHLGECWKKIGTCFRCGSIDHQGRGAPGRGTGNIEARQPTLVYAARHREDSEAPDVITGTFFIHNLPYVALIDIGSTYSYVTCTVSEVLGIQFESTASEMTVLSPLGQSIRVDKLFKDVPLEVQGVVFPANLMELPFGEFDFILGMDWLVKHRAKLDCADKRLVLRTSESEKVAVIRERKDYLSNVISALRAEKLVRKGCEAFLAYINNSKTKSLSVEDVRIVKEFSNVFPEELPDLPPDREVEFEIKLLPGIAPVRFVEGFSVIAAPLTKLLRKGCRLSGQINSKRVLRN